MTRLFVRAFGALIVAGGVAAGAGVAAHEFRQAQQPPPPQTQSPPQAPRQPAFRASANVIHLDVSVLDRQRRPVRGLTRDDFVVYDDGAAQTITTFAAIDVPQVEFEPGAAAWADDLPHDVQSNEGVQHPEGRLFVLLIDDAMIPDHPGSIQTAKHVGRQFIDRMTPLDRLAVVFSASSGGQNFTHDRARLIQAIESLQRGHAKHLLGWDSVWDRRIPPSSALGMPQEIQIAGPLFDSDNVLRTASMQTLRQVAETLISAPHRRKALIYISPGIAIDELAAAAPMRVGDPGRADTNPAYHAQAALRDANVSLRNQLPDLFLRMQRANVTIYPFDPAGAGGFENYISAMAASTPSLAGAQDLPPAFYDFLNPAGHPEFRPRPQDLARHVSTLSLQFLDTIAGNTGGRAIVNTNDFDTALDSILDENSSYYLIGYPQPDGQPAGSIHRIRVEVKRPDVVVRARSGYLTPAAPARASRRAPVSPLDKAITGAVPEDAIPMRVVLAPFAVPGRVDPLVTIALGLTQPVGEARAGSAIEIQTNAYRPDGTPQFIGRRHTARVVLAPKPGVASAQYDLLSHIALKPGRYELRISAYRGGDQVQGSVYADVEVPDFANAPLSVSGVAVQSTPAPMAAPPDAFGTLLPVVPSTNREFRSSDRGLVFFQVHQGGGRPLEVVTVAAAMHNGRGEVVGRGEGLLTVDQFHAGGRSAEYYFELPVAVLPPGQYTAAFDVSMGGHRVRRAVRFAVVGQ